MTAVQRHKGEGSFQATYGFGLFPTPTYRPARQGAWSISTHLPALGDGYLSRAVLEERVVLTRGRKVWMSIGLLEKESHAWHVDCAEGIVVAAGLGMGMYAYAAAMKPEVEMVIVADISADIIKLMQTSTDFDNWPCRDKVRIVQADALTPEFAEEVEELTRGRSVDYLYADIWPNFPAAEAPEQTGAMAEALRPRAAGWWGQELALAEYCRERQQIVSAECFRACFSECGVPVPDCSEGYLSFCRDLMAAYGMGPRRSLGQRLKALFAG